MTKKELERVVDVMRSLMRMARKPLVTRRGNLMIEALVEEFSEKPKKKPKAEKTSGCDNCD